MESLKRQIAERFFERELDEDFSLGVKEGKRLMAALAKVEIHYAKTRYAGHATKTRVEGYEAAIRDLTDILSGKRAPKDGF